MQRASDPDPGSWPVLVTGAGGFVGGHIARHLARAGHTVRGLSRAQPDVLSGDPPIEWILGNVRDPAFLRSAVAGMRGVIHTAAWVSLGRDRPSLAPGTHGGCLYRSCGSDTPVGLVLGAFPEE